MNFIEERKRNYTFKNYIFVVLVVIKLNKPISTLNHLETIVQQHSVCNIILHWPEQNIKCRPGKKY